MSPLSALLRAEIEAAGPITFARFMETALYHHDLGYYAGRRRLGRGGDFLTSVCTGELFGELIAFTLAEWAAERGTAPVQIVEAGAHDGRLARDILDWFRHWRAGGPSMEYWILEPSPARRAWQRETLGDLATRVRWAGDWGELPAGGVRGMILSNELLDALPVRRWGWDASRRGWYEWGVGVHGDRLAWVRLGEAEGRGTTGVRGDESQADDFPALPCELTGVLPDGFIFETGAAAAGWWRKAAAALAQGRLLTFDYGFARDERFCPARVGGTLRAYAGHRVTDVALDRAGEQDLTAHIDFGVLQAVGEAAGLKTEELTYQGDFVMRAVARIDGDPDRFPAWTAARRRQLATLVHPEHLGRAFRVLSQSRKAQS